MSCNVLIVDDASFVRMLIRQVLFRVAHIDPLEAKNGFEAIELYKENRPALTIMDITMPELDGLSALKEILSFDPAAKIIMCSAVARGDIIREAMDLGASDFIAKPFALDELGIMVKKHLYLVS